MLSLSRLEEVAGKAEKLRCLLRSAFFDDAPRIEAAIFEQLLQLLEHWFPAPTSSNTTPAPQLDGDNDKDARLLIEQYYLQEVFAALLFLSDESFFLNRAVSVVLLPRLEKRNVLKSEFYVDLHVRRFCTELLLYFCFSQVCRTPRIVQALYPLLLHDNHALVNGASQNQVGEGLFDTPRFLQKKTLVSSLLNGVMLTLHDGVVGVVRVLLLDDRVEDCMTVDAARHIASLFSTPLRRAWLLKEGSVTYTKCLGLDEQALLLSVQLVDLMASDTETSLTPDEERVQFRSSHLLQQQKINQEKRFLKRETIQERLHLGIATIFNATLHLMPRSEDKSLFARSYKCFCLYNRYLLTPAFCVLTLRVAAKSDTDEILFALRRLSVLARGSTLGPSPRALLLTLEPLSPGILELLALADTLPVQHSALLQKVLGALWELSAQFETLAHMFVRGAFMPVRGSYSVDRVQAKVIVDFEHASSSVMRIRGLRRLLLNGSIPKDAICKLLMAMATMCQQRAAMATAAHVEEKKCSKSAAFLFAENELEMNSGNDNEDIMLAHMVEEMCLSLTSDELFGTCVTLDRICEVLSTVVTISYACWHWAMLLIPRILSVNVIHTVFAQYTTNIERQKAARLFISQAQRLLSLVNALHDAVVNTEATTTLENCIAAVQQYNSDADVDDATFVECRGIVRLLEESLDMKSTASLVVHLLALARIAEQAASCLHRKLLTADKKKLNGNPFSDSVEGRDVVQTALWLLFRVLIEVDDACAAVAACKTVVWWSLARLDSVDSSFVARLVVGLLGVEDNSPIALCSVLPGVKNTVTPPQIGRMKVRLLDILLGLCDYDEEGRTLRNIDDYCKLERKCTLYDILVELCGPQHGPVVQVAALHLIGHYAIATYPRVSLAATCALCVDVFRHTPHEMAKAACASMLSNVAGTLEAMGILAALSDVDVELLQRIAEAMCSYRGAAGADDDHEAVIHHHGRCIRKVLQHLFYGLREA
ncbi:hypothetical protein TCSYLVIO_002380 [Trypanosoma cruzi]|nr:hypothetical protein TCSYLVIO_002380 [Trypanosoma cruzi]